MLSYLSKSQNQRTARGPEPGLCEEKIRLQREFLQTIHELSKLQSQQTQAVLEGDPDFSRFDVLLHLAQEAKEQAKYAWMAHVESHNCEEQ